MRASQAVESGRDECGAQERAHVFEPLSQPLGRQRVIIEQAPQEWGVAEVGQQCAVTGQHKLLGVVLSEGAEIHLAGKIGDGAIEQRANHSGEVDTEAGSTIEGLATQQADVVGVLLKEAKPDVDDSSEIEEDPDP